MKKAILFALAATLLASCAKQNQTTLQGAEEMRKTTTVQAADSWFSHLSISAHKDDGSGKTGTDWLEAVSDKEYSKLK